jgi:hypothetical protein
VQKLAPFFPPQSPLQAMNLRAALFRALNQLKKDGKFYKDVTIRKTMLDECKGEKFEEVLATFSTTVMYKILKEWHELEKSIAAKMVTTPTPSVGEQRSLLPLAIAHRASLTNLLKKKQKLQNTYRQFHSALDSKEEDLRRDKARLYKIMEKVDACTTQQESVLAEITKQFDTCWEGDPKWKEIILKGNKIDIPDSILDEPIPTWGRRIIGSVTGDASSSHQSSLSQDLDQRVKVQQARLEQWKSFKDDLKAGTLEDSGDPKSSGKARRTRSMGISFDGHQDLMINPDEVTRATFDGPSVRRGSVSDMVDEYEKLTKAMQEKLTLVDQPKEILSSRRQRAPITRMTDDQTESSDTRTLSDNRLEDKLGKTSDESIRLANPCKGLDKGKSAVRDHGGSESSTKESPKFSSVSEAPSEAANVTPSQAKCRLTPAEGFTELASSLRTQKIVQSDLNGIGSSKPSLVERTRKSMALAKAEDGVERSVTPPDDGPRSPIRGPDGMGPGSNVKLTGRETLLERTRQSMSMLPVRPRVPRTSMLKQPTKVYPTNPFETPKKSHADVTEISTPPEELFGQDANYASVFKSRPKIAVSPVQSPSLACIEGPHEAGNGPSRENEVGEMASSPPRKSGLRAGRG